MEPSEQLQRDVFLTTLAVGAVAEIGWTAYLSLALPRHYVANHWDLAWVGLDSAQVIFLLLTAWAAWRRRAILIIFANTAATLLLMDAWFDVLTARYRDLGQSLLSLTIELPSAAALLWVSHRTARRLIRTWTTDADILPIASRHLPIPRQPAKETADPPR